MTQPTQPSFVHASLMRLMNHPQHAYRALLGVSLALVLATVAASLLGASWLVGETGLACGALLATATVLAPTTGQEDIGGVSQLLFAGSLLFAALAVASLLIPASLMTGPGDHQAAMIGVVLLSAFSVAGALGGIGNRLICASMMLDSKNLNRPATR